MGEENGSEKILWFIGTLEFNSFGVVEMDSCVSSCFDFALCACNIREYTKNSLSMCFTMMLYQEKSRRVKSKKKYLYLSR